MLSIWCGALPDKPGFKSRFPPSQLNVRTLFVYNILQGAYLGYIQVFWQPFLLTLGLSIAAIGTLETLTGRFGLLASLTQVFGGRLSDRTGRRKIVLLGSVLLISCWSTAALAFVLETKYLIYVAYPLWSLSAMATPVLDAVLADSVSPHDRSRIYSLIMLANVVPGALTGYATGILVSRLHPQFFLGLAALLESAGFIVIQSKLRNIRLPPEELAAEAEITSFKRLLRDFREYHRLFSVFAADSLSWSIATTLLPAILRASKGYTPADFGLIAVTLTVGNVLGIIPGGFLTNRIGARNLLIISEALGLATWSGWLIRPQAIYAPLYALMWGLAITTWVPVQFQVLTDTFPAERRGALLGAVATFRGLIAILGPLISTLLYLKLGYSAPFIAADLGLALAIILIILVVPKRRMATEGDANNPQ